MLMKFCSWLDLNKKLEFINKVSLRKLQLDKLFLNPYTETVNPGSRKSVKCSKKQCFEKSVLFNHSYHTQMRWFYGIVFV